MIETAESTSDRLRTLIAEAGAKGDKVAIFRRLAELEPDMIGIPDIENLLSELSLVRGWAKTANDILKRVKVRIKAQESLLRIADPDERRPIERPAKLPEGWEDPAGWEVRDSGIWLYRLNNEGETKEIHVALDPLWIRARWRDVDTGNHLLELEWPTGKLLINRGTARSSRELPPLATTGAPFSSRNCADMSSFIEHAEKCNEDIIPLQTSISRLGWTMVEGERAFQVAVGPHMLKAEEGHAQTTRALARVGTLQKWMDAAKIVNKHPIPALLLAASVSSILLEPTGGAPFVVDLYGHSSRGKTTALRWAASAWADPTDQGAYILPWSATIAAVEGRASFLQHLPLLIDDTKKIPPKDRDKLGNLVFSWGSGQGKARARPDGVRCIQTWKSVMISTGEAPLTKLAGEHIGVRLRVLPISGQPIPSGDMAVSVIESLESWGHVGPLVAAWAVENWDGLRERWLKIKEAAERRLDAGPSAGRIAGYLASIRLAVDALRTLGVPMPVQEIDTILIQSAKRALESADTASEAWSRVTVWLVTQSDRIQYLHGSDPKAKAPNGGWIGKVLQNGSLALSPVAIDAELRRMGFEPEEILPLWANEARISREDTLFTKVVKWMGKSTRMYVLIGLEGWTPINNVEED
jgi:hypothetical protein